MNAKEKETTPKTEQTKGKKPVTTRTILTFVGAILLIGLALFLIHRYIPEMAPGLTKTTEPQTLAEALTSAQEQGKPILVLLTKSGIGPYEVTTLAKGEVASLLPNFVLLKARMLSDPRYLTDYGIKRSPTWLFLTPDGKEIDRGEGNITSSYLTDIMRDVLAQPVPFRDLEARVKDDSSTDYATIARVAQIQFNREDTAALANVERVLKSTTLSESDPLRASVLIIQADYFLATGKFRESLADIEAFKRITPESKRMPEVLYKEILVRARLNQTSEIRNVLDQVVSKYPNAEDSIQSLYFYFLDYRAGFQKDLSGTAEELQKFIEANPSSPLTPHAKFALANILCSNPAKTPQGLAILKEIYSDSAAEAQLASDAEDKMMVVSLQNNNLPYAILELQTLLDNKMPNADVISLKLADLYQKYHQPERAIEMLTSVSVNYPKSPTADDALRALGAIHLKTTRNYDKALESFQKIVSDYPQSDSFDQGKYFGVLTLYTAKRFNEAQALVEKYLSTEPKESDLAAELIRLRDHLSKNRDYNDTPLSLLVDGNVAAQNGDLEKALKLYDQIINQYSGSNVKDDALMAKAQIYLNFAQQAKDKGTFTKELKEAQALLKTVIEKMPQGDQAENAKRLNEQIQSYLRRM